MRKWIWLGIGLGVGARLSGVRLATGNWQDSALGGSTSDVPLAGRLSDPTGVWIRLPGSPRTLLVFRGRGSRSPEAYREISEAVPYEISFNDEPLIPSMAILGTPTVTVGPPKKITTDWERELGLLVRDPDGWRRAGVPLYEPITEEDFWRYAAESTTMPYPYDDGPGLDRAEDERRATAELQDAEYEGRVGEFLRLDPDLPPDGRRT